MLLNATHITPELESYPDSPPPPEQPRSTPTLPGFPMPKSQPQPAAPEPSGVFADPPHGQRDAEAMAEITPEQIKAAYRWMGAIGVNGQAAGNGNWVACAGGDYNQVTGHWREKDEAGRYRLLSIFELAAREDRFQTVHDARLKLFDEESIARRRGPKQPESEETPAAKPKKEKQAADAVHKGTVTVQHETAPGDCSYNVFPGCKDNQKEGCQTLPNLGKLSAARLLLESAQQKLRTVRTQFGFAEAIHEIDLAASDLCHEIALLEESLRELPAERAKAQSSEMPAVDGTAEPPRANENPDVPELRDTTVEAMGIAKGTCNLLNQAGVATYGDIIEKIGAEQDWLALTELPGIGKAKVDSIRGACEKLNEKVRS